MTRICRNLLTLALVFGHLPIALASTTLYVNGATGSDTNNCMSVQTACKTIGHAISVASSGDTVRVAAATYAEHLTIGSSLELIGAGASTTIIDGSKTGTVIRIPNGSVVTIANVTIRNGYSTNKYPYGTVAGGIANEGTLTINSSTVSGNAVSAPGYAYGGGIWNSSGKLTINNSTLSGNTAGCTNSVLHCVADGGGISTTFGTVTINNSTIAGNTASRGSGFLNPSVARGGGIYNYYATVTISSSTISGNAAFSGGGGIYGGANLQNSIVAINFPNFAGNCRGRTGSSIFSLSSDNSCNLNGPGDLNNVDPKLGTLGNYGGPTQTIPLLSGSPAIDAGNPSGCTDVSGRLLKTDQRGMPRPNEEDTGGCDMGAYESQGD